MERFKDYVYEHIDLEDVMARGKEAVERMASAQDFDSFCEAVKSFDELHRRVEDSAVLCEIRHTIDTTDEYYSAEQDYLDSVMPEFEDLLTGFAKAFLREDMRQEASARWGEHTLTKCMYQVKSFDPCLIELKKKENALMSTYQNIMASSVIAFDGKELTLPALMTYFRSPEAQVRSDAMKAFSGFLHEREKDLDPLFDEMVSVRTEMGKLMGYEDYIPLGYLSMRRYDYDRDDVESYRQKVKKYLVPVAKAIKEKQAERTGQEKPLFRDNWFEYPEGNPAPKGDAAELLEKAGRMYSAIGEESEELFSVMKGADLFDLTSRPGKAQGGYCTFIPGQKVPFIFANFNGTTDDVETLTHEFGHALNAWFMRDSELLIQQELTMETAEIHSTSMEFFTHPWMEEFFGDDADRFRYSHLAGTVFAMVYECCVDEFQHRVYADPSMTPDERKAVWHELESVYMPTWDHGGDPNLTRGLYWLRQLHIFECPFYYIDYSLASFCALQFYYQMKKDRKKAWDEYISLSRRGGMIPFRKLIAASGLADPFSGSALEELASSIMEELGLK
ncbi:MAG: M3 family oligoendopeptidase [Eubacteriaceae bacterium]|nr:M3 family oligoendopeptidase [Eubacteriaceae bacterium]